MTATAKPNTLKLGMQKSLIAYCQSFIVKSQLNFRRFLAISDKPKAISGFTLIELLVVIAIAGILVAISVPNLISFNRRQQLKNGLQEIKIVLRFAQNKALASEIDLTLCSATYQGGAKLLGWYAYFPTSGTSYQITGRCAPALEFGRRDFNLPQGLSFENSREIVVLFLPSATVKFFDSLLDLDNPNSAESPSIPVQVKNQVNQTVQVTVTARGEIK